MADINKSDILLMQSQRLDETDQGGGQMTSSPVVSGAVNNLFPDISRLDRVYGRVSMRKAYASVQTNDRSTYYGAHAIMTEQVEDPGVSVCFFSSEDWFDTRDNARDRIESYLVKGPHKKVALWGNHFVGTKILTFFTEADWEVPEVGDVIVLASDDDEQYARIIDITSEIKKFSDNSGDFYKKILTISIGTQIEKNLIGEEMLRNFIYSSRFLETMIYDTVAADASNYYGVSILSEEATSGQLQIKIDDIQTQLVPSSASDSAITDAGVGRGASPLIQTNEDTITRQISFDIQANSTLYIGEGIMPGSLEWTGGGLSLTEDSKGNVYNGSEIIGSIAYDTGIMLFGNTGISSSGTATITYRPACTTAQISQTGAINIDINNRGFVYTFNCEPLPQRGTVKIDYLASGKWYSIWDQGNGQLAGFDESIGSGSVNFETGSVSITLGAMPDVGSKVIIYWTKPVEYYDLSGETLPLEYTFTTQNPAVARNTFSITWEENTVGAFDDGNGTLEYKTWDDVGEVWVDTGLTTGTIKYTTGEVNLIPHINGIMPSALEGFRIKYSYGNPIQEEFFAPPRDGNGHITINLTNTPILPKTFRIEWHNYLQEYDPETQIDADRDPTYVFFDDGLGEFENDIDDGTTNWIKGTIDYATGEVTFHPERTSTFPYAQYDWVDTEWMHPGVVQTWMFTGISYLPGMSYFPTEGTIYVSFCSVDGVNEDDYITGMEPKFFVKKYEPGMEIIPGGAGIRFGSQYVIDGGNGKLYTHLDGIDGDKTEVGKINYVEKTFSITSDSIDMTSAEVLFCSGSAKIEPMQTIVFRAPGSPLVPGSLFVKGTTGEGTIIQGSSDFSGNITGPGIEGIVDFETGLCQVAFGEYVTDDAEAQAQNWYNAELASGGVVWKPYSVRASTILINCVVRSYLPLDPDLLKLDPVRLPIDGKVPIFRDGYILVVHHSLEEYMPYPLGTGSSLPSDTTLGVGRTNVDLIEAYSMPTAAQLNEGTQVVPIYIEETGNYTYDLDTGEITFLAGFVYPTDSYGTQNQVIALSRIEDMCLASDVQVTGHIAITNALTHTYPANETLVSSVLPISDMQSRAYNEFEQDAWTNEWSDDPIGAGPLASYNFVDYPITITNKASIKERWLLIFSTSTTISVIGENFGVLAENVSITSGNVIINDDACIAIENKQYPGEYYWIIRCDGFGSGWASGNCIRFNTDPANYPLWFVRTTLQGPQTEPVDHYTLMIRGDSS